MSLFFTPLLPSGHCSERIHGLDPKEIKFCPKCLAGICCIYFRNDKNKYEVNCSLETNTKVNFVPDTSGMQVRARCHPSMISTKWRTSPP